MTGRYAWAVVLTIGAVGAFMAASIAPNAHGSTWVVSASSAVMGVLTAAALGLVSKILEETDEKRRIVAAILAELYFRAEQLPELARFLASVSPNEPVVREHLAVLLRGDPTLLVELLKKIALLPVSSHRPLIAFLENLTALKAIGKSLPTSEAARNVPDWQMANLRTEVSEGCQNAYSAIISLEQIAGSGARSDLQLRNAITRDKLRQLGLGGSGNAT